MPDGRLDPQIAQLIAGEDIPVGPQPDLIGYLEPALSIGKHQYFSPTTSQLSNNRRARVQELRSMVMPMVWDQRPVRVVDPLEPQNERLVQESKRRLLEVRADPSSSSPALYTAHFMIGHTLKAPESKGLPVDSLFETMRSYVPPVQCIPNVDRRCFEAGLETWAMARSMLHAVVPRRDDKDARLLRIYGIAWRDRPLSYEAARAYAEGMAHFFDNR